MMTWRIRVVGLSEKRLAKSMHPRGSVILACFHENAMPGTLSHPGQGVACLVSHSKDGDLVAFVCEKIGLKAVRGSSSRGGRAARDEILDLLLSGGVAAITVDGPRGPRRVPKPGVVDLSKKSQAPILPLSVCVNPNWILKKTWDQSRIPRPFSRVLLHYHEPLVVPPNCEGAEFVSNQDSIHEILQRGDQELASQFESYWRSSSPMPEVF
jgi:lysophospholipid acyltransferase (LPLAT)-like uncharacterized protein